MLFYILSTVHLNEVSAGLICRTGNLSTQVSEPRKKNLYLQSLYEEEQEKFPVTGSNKSGRQDSQSDIQDKDLILSLENEVQCWTDFSKVHYHPRSLYELNGLWVDQEQFNNYGIGRDAFSEGMRGEEMNTRLRFFIEECDHIQVLYIELNLSIHILLRLFLFN